MANFNQGIIQPVKRDQFDFVDKETGEAVRIARYVCFLTLPGQEHSVQTNVKDDGQFEVGRTYTCDVLYLANPKFGVKVDLMNFKLTNVGGMGKAP